MRPRIAIMAIVAAVLLAGCTQQNGDGTTPTNGADGAINPTVTLLEPTGMIQVTAGEEFTVRWSVDPQASGEHDIPHVGVHWGPDSVEPDSSTKPTAYGNNAGVQAATIPDEFMATVTIPEEGTYYLRAHAMADGGTNYWSAAEATIEVEASSGGDAGSGGDGELHTVQIGTQTSCAVANYAPSSLTITAGDSVQWENVDSCPHTATPAGMTGTGNIDAGATSDPIVFNEPGTYEITCDYHGQMSGSVTVEEA